MGVITDYLGYVGVTPALNEAERAYLSAFSRSRRSWRPDGSYAVTPADPGADLRSATDADSAARDAAVDRFNQLGDGQPSHYCHWVPCFGGCCLSWDGQEKFYAGPHWMQYLIDHFLRPGAYAQQSGDRQFAEFTFDHRADGVIAGRQQDNRELFLLVVQQPGDPMPWDAYG